MSDWDRKNLSRLADAVRTRLGAPAVPAAAGRRLKQIGDRAREASKTVQSSVYLLSQVRAELCEVCRDNALYDCDVKLGWSPVCAFLSSNQP